MNKASRDILKKQLIRDEGLRLSAYQDSEGWWTIGVGRLIDKRKGGGITQEEAMYLLDHDIATAEHALFAAFPWTQSLDEVRQRVLISMVFNLGLTKFAEFKRTLAHVQAGRWADAAVGMLESKWAEQVGDRALRLAHAMETGKDVV